MAWELLVIGWLYIWGAVLSWASLRLQTRGSAGVHAFCAVVWPVLLPIAFSTWLAAINAEKGGK